MGLFDLFTSPDINSGVEQYKNTENAVLLDVRTKEEFEEGHIPGAVNIPLQEISDVEDRFPDFETVFFTYCRSGARSSSARQLMIQMGYENVINIGGILSYKGEIEK